MNETRWRLPSDLAERAGDDGDRWLMSGGARYTDARGEEQVLYGFVQCTRDLEASECTRCLVLALTLLSERKDLNSSLAGSVKGPLKPAGTSDHYIKRRLIIKSVSISLVFSFFWYSLTQGLRLHSDFFFETEDFIAFQ
jgi:hypothetical protein